MRPKTIPGRTPKKRAQVEAGVLSQLQAYDDATLEQHCAMWEQTYGERVSRWTMSRAVKRLGWTRKKKSLRASEQKEAERSAWREQAAKLSTETLVIVDETGSQINMTPLDAYAPRGERAIGKVPRNYGANLTVIASLSLSGMGEAMLLDGSADAVAFEAYVEQLLAPSLRPGQIVILDNLSIHLGPRVKDAIEARGCHLLFLPAYSPDFSPIEGAFSKLKTILRRVGARTREALQEAIIQALPCITAQDALGWFLHCGYPAPSAGNTAQSFGTPLYGAPELLPFDLRMRRVIRYYMPLKALSRASERKRLVEMFVEALRASLSSADVPLLEVEDQSCPVLYPLNKLEGIIDSQSGLVQWGRGVTSISPAHERLHKLRRWASLYY